MAERPESGPQIAFLFFFVAQEELDCFLDDGRDSGVPSGCRYLKQSCVMLGLYFDRGSHNSIYIERGNR